MAEICSRFRPGIFRRGQPFVEVLNAVFALIRYVRRVVDHHVELFARERHGPVVRNHVRPVLWVDVHADHGPGTADPEAALVDRGVKSAFRSLSGIEVEHLFEKLGVGPVPDGRQRIVGPRRRLNGGSGSGNRGVASTFDHGAGPCRSPSPREGKRIRSALSSPAVPQPSGFAG